MLKSIEQILEMYLQNKMGSLAVQLPRTRLPNLPVCSARMTDTTGVQPPVPLLTMETTYG